MHGTPLMATYVSSAPESAAAARMRWAAALPMRLVGRLGLRLARRFALPRRAVLLSAMLAAVWSAPLALAADPPKPGARPAPPQVATQATTPAPSEAPRERRLALVLGNARYATAPLNNPENDARVIGSTLRRLGFEVSEHVNLPAREMRRVLRDFARRVQNEDGVALFYYAGHGVQIEGRNYLLPVDFIARDEDEAKDSGVDIDDIFVSRLERAKAPVRIVILDACRDNPFDTRVAGRSRSVRGSGGLAEMGGRGALIAFASAPGATAEDGPPGTNSVYTRHLAAEMLVEGVEVEQMFKNVRVKVLRDTQQRQIPWVNTSLTANFSFNPRSPGPGAGSEDGARREELARLQALLEQRDREQRRLEAQLRQLRERSESANAAEGPDGANGTNGTGGTGGTSGTSGTSGAGVTPALNAAGAPIGPSIAPALAAPTTPTPAASPAATQAAGNSAGNATAPAPGPLRPATVAQAPPRKPDATVPPAATAATPAPARSRPGVLSERCAALLIRAQLGEPLAAADMAHLQKECR
jgi:hypothetical protein